MQFYKIKKQFNQLLLLLTVLYISGCKQTIDSHQVCYITSNNDRVCELNITSIIGDTNYLEFEAPQSVTDISLYLELYHKEGNIKVWIEDSKHYITPLSHFVDTMTMPETIGNKMIIKKYTQEKWKLSGQAKVEYTLGQAVFKIYLEPERDFFTKEAKNIIMKLRYKREKVEGQTPNKE